MNSNLPGYLFPSVSSPTGVILLDVENCPFKLDLEQCLKPHCNYRMSLKFAVANWQNNSVSKLDRHLHQQGYQLIHVPKDKNAADAQILTLGGSLPLNYPHVKEVVIVSGDSIFNYLHQTLQRQGISTYKIYQQSGNIYINNFISDRPSIITKVSTHTPGLTKEHEIQSKIEQTLIELTQKSQDKISLSQLSQEFKLKYRKSISEILKSNKLPKSASNFIKQSCADKIFLEHTSNTNYVSLKSL